MKVALLGSGKTGLHVAKLHENTIIFNSKNKPTIEELKLCDVVISFLPGDVFSEYIPLLTQSKLPVITGSTGLQWPVNLEQELKSQDAIWIRAHNFSLGMNIVKAMIEKLTLASSLYPEVQFSINETHHTKKLDSPSGTALSFKKWLGKEVEITSYREGDVIGDHTIKMDSNFESITLNHNAKDRALFASGALWAANIVLKNKIPSGLYNFDEIVNSHLGI